MLPKYHIILGLIISTGLYLLNINFFPCLIFLFSSIFIDVDHYFFYAIRKNDLSLRRAYIWHKSLGKHHKPIMQIFHTLEFILLILIMAFFSNIFLFILFGMLFHSITDIIEMLIDKNLYTREFSFINYLKTDKRKYL